MSNSSPTRVRHARPADHKDASILRRRLHAAWLIPLFGCAMLALYGIMLLFEVPLT